LLENTGVITSNGSSSSSDWKLCESEIDRSGWETEETQIVTESLSSGSYIIFGLPCHDPAYSGVEMEGCNLGVGFNHLFTDWDLGCRATTQILEITEACMPIEFLSPRSVRKSTLGIPKFISSPTALQYMVCAEME